MRGRWKAVLRVLCVCYLYGAVSLLWSGASLITREDWDLLTAYKRLLSPGEMRVSSHALRYANQSSAFNQIPNVDLNHVATVQTTHADAATKRNISLNANHSSVIKASVRSLRTNSTSAKSSIKNSQQKSNNITISEAEFYRRREHKVNAFNHSFILHHEDLCDNTTEMLIIVHSFHPYRAKRDAIRATWGGAARGLPWPGSGQNTSSLRLLFLLGLHHNDSLNRLLAEEDAQHGDIVQGDFMDDYRNMTLKSLLGLKFISSHCTAARYLLKSDDDMIVHLPYLLDVLAEKKLKRAVMGPQNKHSTPFRVGKWKLTWEEFPFVRFPVYESGAAYVITADVTKELLDTSDYVPWIFIDDVYITGILGRILGLKHVTQRGFAYWGSRAPDACTLVNRKVLTGTKMTPALLRGIWQQLEAPPKCKAPQSKQRAPSKSPSQRKQSATSKRLKKKAN